MTILYTLFYIAWLVPLSYLLAGIIGYIIIGRGKYLVTNPAKLIIQITTLASPSLINRTIRRIRGYNLPMPYQVWVVVEPWMNGGKVDGYEADKIIVVPDTFTANAKYKARALEYARLVRKSLGIVGNDVKILLLDDDSIASERYICKAFYADYDICEGITVPRNNYGTFLSHMDNVRTCQCLCINSLFQGSGYPLWVHGEGLCFYASVEHAITWEAVGVAEDWMFGQRGVDMGYKWGFLWEFVYITSPWSIKDHIKQRRRWFWACIDALQQSSVSSRAKCMLLFGIFVIFFGPIFCVSGLVYTAIAGPYWIPSMYPLYANTTFLMGLFAFVGWLGGGKLKHVVVATVLSWVAVIMVPISGILIPLVQGPPKTWLYIRK